MLNYSIKDNMKIGLVTLHNSYSYGACLQAYATYLVLSQMGYDVEFVNYTNSFEQSQNRIISTNPLLGIKGNIVKTLENIFLRQYYNRKASFDHFHRTLKKSLYFSKIEDMQDLKYDILLSGSDQLWNPDIFNKLDEVFFLNFGVANKRLSYAASAGSYVFSDQERERLSCLLSRYDYISTREERLNQLVTKLTGREDIKNVIDPTLLVTKERWREVASLVPSAVPDRDFILLYMIGVPYKEYKRTYLPIVEYYKRRLGLRVYAITSFSFIKVAGTDKSLNILSPEQFIKVIGDASLIITSSFHGVAFSIIQNKLFVALSTANPVRINNLLKILNIDGRVLDSFNSDTCEALLTPPNYDSVNSILYELRSDSLGWLNNSIEYDK